MVHSLDFNMARHRIAKNFLARVAINAELRPGPVRWSTPDIIAYRCFPDRQTRRTEPEISALSFRSENCCISGGP